jgi:hypothetical protein
VVAAGVAQADSISAAIVSRLSQPKRRLRAFMVFSPPTNVCSLSGSLAKGGNRAVTPLGGESKKTLRSRKRTTPQLGHPQMTQIAADFSGSLSAVICEICGLILWQTLRV